MHSRRTALTLALIFATAGAVFVVSSPAAVPEVRSVHTVAQPVAAPPDNTAEVYAFFQAQVAAEQAEAARVVQEAAARARATATTRPPVAPAQSFDSSLQPCGGSYPPCWVAERESHGNYNAFNPTGCYSNGRSGCYGKWQFGWFWGGKLGLPDDLSTATPAQQDEAARQLWNGGSGCSNWAAC